MRGKKIYAMRRGSNPGLLWSMLNAFHHEVICRAYIIFVPMLQDYENNKDRLNNIKYIVLFHFRHIL